MNVKFDFVKIGTSLRGVSTSALVLAVCFSAAWIHSLIFGFDQTFCNYQVDKDAGCSNSIFLVFVFVFVLSGYVLRKFGKWLIELGEK